MTIVVFLIGIYLGGVIAVAMLTYPLTGKLGRMLSNSFTWPIWVTRLFTGYWRNQ